MELGKLNPVENRIEGVTLELRKINKTLQSLLDELQDHHITLDIKDVKVSEETP